MLGELAAAFAGLVATSILVLVTHKIFRNRWLLERYKKLSNGIPICDDFNPLCAHHTSLTLGRDNCHKMKAANEKLGKYAGFLIGEKFCVTTTDLNLIKRVAVDEANLHQDRMSFELPINEFEESMMLTPGDKWRPQRRVFAAALRPNKFKTPNVLQEIEQTIGKLLAHLESKLNLENRTDTGTGAAEAGTILQLDDIIHRYSLNLVFSCFYKQYNQIDFDAPVCEWTRAIDAMAQELPTHITIKLTASFPWLRRPLDWIIWNLNKHGTTRQKILEFIQLQTKRGIEARRSSRGAAPGSAVGDKPDNLLLADGTQYKRNIIDHVIDAFLDGKLAKSDYFNSSHFLLIAADKTAADCLVHTLYLLSINPHVQEKLRESVRLEGEESEYLSWVFSESLRLLPPVPGGCSRSVSKSIGLDNGMVVPAGTYVVTNCYAIHRLKQYWGEDADEFRPERWADTSKHHPMQYFPFGAGPRGCPGREFALFTMKLLMVALLTRYQFEGNVRADAYEFSAPCFLYINPNSHTHVTIKRVV